MLTKIRNLLKGKRLITTDEKQLQEQIMILLVASGWFADIKKEYTLGDKGRVDFFIDGTAIEIKTKGSAMAIYRQLKLYAEHEEVKEIILITAKSMTLPGSINNKPSGFINISKAWL